MRLCVVEDLQVYLKGMLPAVTDAVGWEQHFQRQDPIETVRHRFPSAGGWLVSPHEE